MALRGPPMASRAAKRATTSSQDSRSLPMSKLAICLYLTSRLKPVTRATTRPFQERSSASSETRPSWRSLPKSRSTKSKQICCKGTAERNRTWSIQQPDRSAAIEGQTRKHLLRPEPRARTCRIRLILGHLSNINSTIYLPRRTKGITKARPWRQGQALSSKRRQVRDDNVFRGNRLGRNVSKESAGWGLLSDREIPPPKSYGSVFGPDE
jgi:hypothetical protein